MNYLRAARIEVGLLMDFGPKAEFKRFIFDNDSQKQNDTYPENSNT